MKKFVNWLENNGVDTDNLNIIDQKNKERGILSNKEIKSGNHVFLIPNKLLITNRTAEKFPEIKNLHKIFRDKSETELNIIMIAVFMLYAEAYESIMKDVNWTPYFDILPETLDHIPLFWDKELEYLKGSYLYDKIKDRVKMIKQEYKTIKKEISNFKLFNFYEYLRMRSIVSSRNFKLNIHGDVVSAMVPFADMLNHSPTCQTRWSFNDNLDSYQMVAKKDIQKGVEITDSYGIKPLDNYFLYYGFLLPDTEVRLFIEVEEFEGFITDNINDNRFNRFLNYVRRQVIQNDNYNSGFKDIQTEITTLKAILDLLQQIKKGFPHTKKYYDRYKNSKNQNKSNAYTYISQELKVIETLIEKMQILIKYLSGKKVNPKYNDIKNYILNNIER